METLDDVFDTLWEEEWQKIPGMHYLIKYKFSEDGYALMLTNLCETYGEKLADSDLTERFSKLNPFATMKPRVIVSKIKLALQNALSELGAEIGVKDVCQSLTLYLRFNLCATPLYFDFHPQVLPCEKVRTHLIAPLVLTSLQACLENMQLREKISNLEKKTAVLGPSCFKEDHKVMMSMISALNKRSKANETEILDSFLQLSKNMKKNNLGIKENFDGDGKGHHKLTSHSDEFTSSLLIKEEVKDSKSFISQIPFTESGISTSRSLIKEEIKDSQLWFAYEDETDSQAMSFEPVVYQQPNVVVPQNNATDVEAKPSVVIKPVDSASDKYDGGTSKPSHSGQVKKKKKLLNI